jgi:prepilin-type N-terminal cleavage/methylation domain-containing protein
MLPISGSIRISAQQLGSKRQSSVLGSMRRAQRRYITLIEVMIVMALLAVLAGVTGIAVRRAVLDERYRAGVAQFVSRLQMAQNIMLIVRGDVTVQLNKQPNGLFCHVDVAQPLLPPLQRIVNRSGVIPGIDAFTWTTLDGRSVTNQPLALNFKSGGARLSRGELKVSGAGRDSYILLSGFAEPVTSNTQSQLAQLQKIVEATPAWERLYPVQVRVALEPFREQLSRQPNFNLLPSPLK